MRTAALAIVLAATMLSLAAGLEAQANSVPGGHTATSTAASQYDPLAAGVPRINPLSQPSFTPGMIQLLELETRFASAVAAGGGKAFASWFADDGVSLANGKPPVMGRTAIAAQAQWSPKDYQLTWQAQGASMGPSNDMGFTWGHYDGAFRDSNGQPLTSSGRYFTVWKKQPDGSWKVALDASADEAPNAGSCCALPKP